MRWLTLLLLLQSAAFAEEVAVPASQPVIAEDILKPPSGVETLALALVRLQDAAATGNAEAGPLQRRMLVELSNNFRAHDPHTLPSPRTLRAAIIYLLSGGRPEDANVLLAATPETELLRWILKGAALYAANDREGAAKALAPFKPELLPHSIGGRVALARAMGLPEAEDEEKVRLLRLAAQLMPGTLVEEASLRRLLVIAAKLGDPGPLQQVAERYLERYRASIYAKEVIARYATALVVLEKRKKPVPRQALEMMFNGLDAGRRRQTYLEIARAAVLRGLADLTLFSATRARRLAEEGSVIWHQATLYDAAILVTSQDHGIGVDLLRQVDAGKLDETGKELLAAALRMAEAIRKPLGLPPVGDDGQHQFSSTQTQLLSKAQALLSSTDSILKDAAQ